MYRRRGQSVVETLLLVPILVVVILATLQLFTLTFAAQHAHLRAREHLLHGRTWSGDRAWRTSGDTVFDERAEERVREAVARHPVVTIDGCKLACAAKMAKALNWAAVRSALENGLSRRSSKPQEMGRTKDVYLTPIASPQTMPSTLRSARERSVLKRESR